MKRPAFRIEWARETGRKEEPIIYGLSQVDGKWKTTRRGFIAAAASLGALTAGCVGSVDQPTATPPATPAPRASHLKEVTEVTYSLDGAKIASGSVDYTVKLWDAKTGSPVKTFSGYHGAALVYSPDGQNIATTRGDEVEIWSVEDGSVLLTMKGHEKNVIAVAYSPDGTKIASGSADANAMIWDAESGTALKTLIGHADIIESVAFSPDGKKLVSGSWDRTIKIWDVETGGELKMLTGHRDLIYCVAYSPDGHKIVSTGRDNDIRIWDAESGALLRKITENPDKGAYKCDVRALAFSPDGKMIASANEKGAVKLWNTDTGALLRELAGETGGANVIAFSPDGARLVTGGSRDFVAKVWSVADGTLILTLVDPAPVWGDSDDTITGTRCICIPVYY